MAKRTGYWKLFTIWGIPTFVHWSFPAGGLLFSIFGYVDPHQWIYYCFAFSLLILLHECGHLLAARFFGLRVFAIDVTGVGGLCRFERPRQVRHSVLVYSAGLLAQVVAFVVALSYWHTFEAPEGGFGRAILITFTLVNAILIVINLIPHRSLRGIDSDGYVLLRLYLHVFKGHRHPHPALVVTPPEAAPVFSSDTRVLEKPGFRPAGFIQGIEILNDRTTPMEFVVTALTDHLDISREEAIVKMLDIHNTGGILIALPTKKRAQDVASAINSAAAQAGHAFICRYVSA